MKKLFFILLILLPVLIFAQQDIEPEKYALVIGNGAYRNLSRLNNPVNDADDMTLALEYLGFTVEKLLNGSLEQMENAVTRLKDKLKASNDSYGFFFYAGHGVQSGGENYLIPVNANIPSESYLRNRSLSVQIILDDLNDAGNSLNVVVLDACRDNPFSWSRGSGRGLAFITRQPADSIIVYATSAGQTASDGEGRNGLFTSQLLPNLVTPGLEVGEVFKRTGSDVSRVSANQQIPAIYSQFFRTAYLGIQPDETGAIPAAPPFEWPQRRINDNRKNIDDTKLWTIGASVGSCFTAPWLIGTARGTIALLPYSFIEIGFDAGFLSGVSDVGFYTLYPFINLSYYRPFLYIGGWYIGAGGGYLMAEYDFPEGAESRSAFMANFITGINLFDFLDISYTLRTNFEFMSNKISVGYIFRFR